MTNMLQAALLPGLRELGLADALCEGIADAMHIIAEFNKHVSAALKISCFDQSFS